VGRPLDQGSHCQTRGSGRLLVLIPIRSSGTECAHCQKHEGRPANRIGRLKLYTNRGLGAILLPARFGCRAPLFLRFSVYFGQCERTGPTEQSRIATCTIGARRNVSRKVCRRGVSLQTLEIEVAKGHRTDIRARNSCCNGTGLMAISGQHKRHAALPWHPRGHDRGRGISRIIEWLLIGGRQALTSLETN
jgi:hypothetical protein